ncbi:hypothetical protein GCM10010220_21850 [Streptomyces parvulus]|nr:hypothetical protein GCM10010220_21850 [Streptomyces parvulus]
MHPPWETDVRRKLSEQVARAPGEMGKWPAGFPVGGPAQHRIQPEPTEREDTLPVTHTQRFPACTVTGPAR